MTSLRNLGLNLVLLIASLTVGALGLELAARLYVGAIANKDRLFTSDPEVGWVPLANIDLERRNVDGELWRIVTDANGVRGPATWPGDAATRLLVLGDSFAFGEGVDLEERFDTILRRRFPDLAVVNLGVMGYGPDQQLIRARRWVGKLRAGDVVLLLTYLGNDFHDLARVRHAGRPKPWLELRGDRLIEHPPATGWLATLRERSYVLARIMRSIALLQSPSERTDRRLAEAGRLYRRLIVQELAPLIRRGVRVVIARHGAGVIDLPFDVTATFAELCPQMTACIDLDPALAAHPRDQVFLSDGHWAPGGHRIAAEALAAHLASLAAQMARDDGPTPVREADAAAPFACKSLSVTGVGQVDPSCDGPPARCRDTPRQASCQEG